MAKRKCIYTGLYSNCKEKIIPSPYVGNEKHNWAINLPVNEEYRHLKDNRMPTDLEIEAHENFYLLELAKIKALYFNKKLENLDKKSVEWNRIFHEFGLVKTKIALLKDKKEYIQKQLKEIFYNERIGKVLKKQEKQEEQEKHKQEKTAKIEKNITVDAELDIDNMLKEQLNKEKKKLWE